MCVHACVGVSLSVRQPVYYVRFLNYCMREFMLKCVWRTGQVTSPLCKNVCVRVIFFFMECACANFCADGRLFVRMRSPV